MEISFQSGAGRLETVCPVCRSIGAEPRLRVTGVPFGRSDLDMAECVACGTFYYTGDDPVIGYDFPGFSDTYWLHYVQSGAGITAMLEPLLALDPTPGQRLLDIGCGFGFVPHFWQSRGFGPAVGLETSRYGHLGKNKLGVTIHHAYYADARALDGQRFDFVYSSEVIEHVPDPGAFLDEISAALAEDGILVLTTPCADAITPDSPYSTIIAVLSPGFHYFVTRENALRRLLQSRGFDHVQVANGGHRLFAWASRKPLPAIGEGFSHWEAYYAYLGDLSRNADPHVASGALYRLVKDAVNRGDFDLLPEAIDRFAALALSAYGLNLLDPAAMVERFLAAERPSNDQFPSWMGCGLLFHARAIHRIGGDARLLVPAVRGAVVAMEHEVKLFAQFAQEPDHFLPLARGFLAELEQEAAQAGPAPAASLPPHFLKRPEGERAGRAAALLCGYAPDGRPSPALIALCAALARAGIDPHVCLVVAPQMLVPAPSAEPASSVAGDAEAGDADVGDSRVGLLPIGVAEAALAELPGAVSLVWRTNDSYDFGAWSAQLAAMPELWRSERLLFINDSIIPTNAAGCADLLEQLRTDRSDFIALTESLSPVHHSQSYLFQLRGAALADWRLRRFWQDIAPGMGKDEVIARCELPLLELARGNSALRARVLYGFPELFPGCPREEWPLGNLSHLLWERLLLLGMPFVKAELLHRNPMNLPLHHWRAVLASAGADLALVDRHLAEMDRTRQLVPRPALTPLPEATSRDVFERLAESAQAEGARPGSPEALPPDAETPEGDLPSEGAREQLQRVRGGPVPDKPRKPKNRSKARAWRRRLLAAILGAERVERLRQWNHRRLARRRQARAG